jgi:hypothetical protein
MVSLGRISQDKEILMKNFLIEFQRYYHHWEWGWDSLLVEAENYASAIIKITGKYSEAKDFKNKYEWKQTIFEPEDFEGSGQYIVRESINKQNGPFIQDSGYLSTVMMKVAYSHKRTKDFKDYRYFFVDMSDGLVNEGYYENSRDANGKMTDISTWKWVGFDADTSLEAKQNLCNYLNDNPYGETYRKATQEEVIRVVLNQKWRCA